MIEKVQNMPLKKITHLKFLKIKLIKKGVFICIIYSKGNNIVSLNSKKKINKRYIF